MALLPTISGKSVRDVGISCSEASWAGLLDWRSGAYWQPLLSAVGLSEATLPSIQARYRTCSRFCFKGLEARVCGHWWCCGANQFFVGGSLCGNPPLTSACQRDVFLTFAPRVRCVLVL